MSALRATWRDGLIGAAAYARMLMQNAVAMAATLDKSGPADAAAHARHAAYAYGHVAEELAHVASLPPTVGLARLRALGTPASRAWAQVRAVGGTTSQAEAAEVEGLTS